VIKKPQVKFPVTGYLVNKVRYSLPPANVTVKVCLNNLIY